MLVPSTVLLALNSKAIRANRNRVLSRNAVEAVDPQGVHVLSRELLHNEVEWRCHVLVKLTGREEPFECWLDIGLRDWPMVVEVDREVRRQLDQVAENA